MDCRQVLECLEQMSPPSYALTWDNVGLLVGRADREVKKICLALDPTSEVIDEAVRTGCDMLLTHHPLIFSSLKKIAGDDFIGRRILTLAENKISYVAMHTNFDVMGMADAVADELKLLNPKVLDVTFEDEISKEGIGRVGKLPNIMTLKECADYVKEVFHLEQVRVYGDDEQVLEMAAVSPGAGKSEIQNAVVSGCDVLITGDIEHHEGIDAMEKGICIIDAGHFGLEKIFVPYLSEYIHRKMPQLTVVEASQKSPFHIL